MGRLEAMQVFVAVVEGGGFSAASRTLGIPLPTVSRRIGELEKQLNRIYAQACVTWRVETVSLPKYEE